jgi:fibronectin-binding autotransporter adhesin
VKTHHKHLLAAHTAAIAITLAIAGSAQAQTTYTWTGGRTNNSWSQPANWGRSTVAMTNQDAVVFYSTASRLDNFIQLDRTINSLSFNANADSNVLIGMGGTNGSKNITFAGTNPHITVNAGSEGNHVIGHNDAVSTRQGLVVLNADLLIAHNGTGDLTIRRPITEDATARGITKNGSGTLFSLGDNTYTGATTVEMGKLTITGSAFASSGIAISSGATFSFANASGTLGYHNDNATNHQISGAGTLMKEGAGTVELSADGRGTTISMSSGALIDIQGGTLRNGQWNNAVWTDNLADLNIAAGATFDTWNGAPIRVNALTGSGSIVNGLNGGETSLTLGVDGGSGIFSGGISAVGLSLIKAGTGTQELAASSSFTGNITIDGGTLQASAGNALGLHRRDHRFGRHAAGQRPTRRDERDGGRPTR